MTRPNRASLAIAAGLLVPVLAATTIVHADEAGFLNRFEGNWSGSGQVRRNAGSSPWNVKCSVTGNPSGSGMAMGGHCRGAIIVSRAIGANLVYDPGTRSYSGTYIGSKLGPAALNGRRNGDRVDLTITWPKPVNGDTKARMSITNDGRGRLRIQVLDEIRPGGPTRTMSDLTFRRS
ncbi:hypothetical protein OSH11_24200 [Kaistia dalseonensis]|uniref:Uncharacterized protein n=1 Tax=Kaistia dalseonensis TaxID=410840 RepID=A0ABU0HDR2_9HYPH|nr:hypothetical protein [Kaistia dalseonensis]MCX5497823.1 hypothetical protein [Kaistia dalseonensis]MDQ0440467.1 hypothetical protein [Kaistia dalseonensis]